MKIIILLIAALVLLFPFYVFATIYTVCPSGCDYTTLSAAAAGVPSGANHTISVAAGTYAGFTDSRSGPGSTVGVDSSYRIWLANGAVTINSDVTVSGDWVKFDGFTFSLSNTERAFTVYDSSDNCWFIDITSVGGKNSAYFDGTDHLIENWDASGIYKQFFIVLGSGHIFRGCYIHDPDPGPAEHCDVWQTYDSGSGAAQDIIIEKNHVFHGDTATGLLLEQEDGVHLFMWEDSDSRHASGLTVRNNIFESLGWLHAGLGRIDGLRVYNNLFRGDDDRNNTGAAPNEIATTYGANDVEIRNNLFIDKDKAIKVGSVTNITNSNNLFWRHDGGAVTNTNYSGSNDITYTDPKFTTYDNDVYNLTDEYKLQSTSPAVDSGYNLTNIVDEDYDEVTRPEGEEYDIGPYEYVTEQSAPTIEGISIQ